MGSLSPVHWLIVMVVVLLLFGPAKLAGMGKGLGEGMRSFKKGLNEDADADKKPEPANAAPRTSEVDAPANGAEPPASRPS
jgi:sec-independent protein translocase protein TatA